jgi:AcrR family transcriptional regulator
MKNFSIEKRMFCMTRGEQKEQRRKQILFCALDLFVKKGYTATQIIDIANAANISTGLLFHYFESKEKLYIELVRMGFQGTQTVNMVNGTEPIEFFTDFVKALFKYAKEQPWTAKMFVLVQQAQNKDGTPQEAYAIAKKVNTIEYTVEIIRKGQENGTIKAGDPATLSKAFWYCIQGIMTQYAIDGSMPLPEPDWIVDVIRN